MKPKLTIRAIPVPADDARRKLRHAIGLLADALADQVIAEARAAVAAELGVVDERIDREGARVGEAVAEIAESPGMLRAAAGGRR